MGYYTDFKLTIIGDSESGLELVKWEDKVAKIAAYMSSEPDSYLAGFVVAGEIDESTSNNYKWYDYRKDMRNLSAAFPDVLFRLDGVGEEDGDLWRCFFIKGNSQFIPAKIHIVYPEVDMEELCNGGDERE